MTHSTHPIYAKEHNMVVVGKRFNLDPLENFKIYITPGAEGVDVTLPGLMNRPPNGSDGRYLGGGKHYYPTPEINEKLVYEPVDKSPNVILGISDVKQIDEAPVFTKGLSRCPLTISDIEPPTIYINVEFSFTHLLLEGFFGVWVWCSQALECSCLKS